MVQTMLALLFASPLSVPHLQGLEAPETATHQLEPKQCTEANPGGHHDHPKAEPPNPKARATALAGPVQNPPPHWKPPAQSAQPSPATGPGDYRTRAARHRTGKAQVAVGTGLLIAGHALNMLAPPAIEVNLKEERPNQRLNVGYSSSTHSTEEIVFGALGTVLRAAGAGLLNRGRRNVQP